MADDNYSSLTGKTKLKNANLVDYNNFNKLALNSSRGKPFVLQSSINSSSLKMLCFLFCLVNLICSIHGQTSTSNLKFFYFLVKYRIMEK